MRRELQPPPRWLGACAIALGFALLAWMLRAYAGYPACNYDEAHWLAIARTVDEGVDWPVSGPAFLYLIRTLANGSGLGYPAMFNAAGVGGVLAAILALLWGYRRLAPTGAGMVLAALALSSYFWAPLLEARPQQWGQVLVLCGALGCWLWLQRRGGWFWFLLLPVTALTHILSHAILLWLCSVLVLADYFEGKPFTRRQAAAGLALLSSLAVYLWPEGPYSAMLFDIVHVHLRRMLGFIPALGAAALAACMLVAVLRRRWHWRAEWSQSAGHLLLRHRAAAHACALLLIAAALALQAWLLPAHAWQPYGGSAWRFLLFQSGNLLFAAFFALGVPPFITLLLEGRGEPLMGRFLVWCLLAFGILGTAAIIASAWLLDTNWFLRLLNYGLLFAGPIAAMGIAQAMASPRAAWPILLIPLGCLASLLFTVRPLGILGC